MYFFKKTEQNTVYLHKLKQAASEIMILDPYRVYSDLISKFEQNEDLSLLLQAREGSVSKSNFEHCLSKDMKADPKEVQMMSNSFFTDKDTIRLSAF